MESALGHAAHIMSVLKGLLSLGAWKGQQDTPLLTAVLQFQCHSIWPHRHFLGCKTPAGMPGLIIIFNASSTLPSGAKVQQKMNAGLSSKEECNEHQAVNNKRQGQGRPYLGCAGLKLPFLSCQLQAQGKHPSAKGSGVFHRAPGLFKG